MNTSDERAQRIADSLQRVLLRTSPQDQIPNFALEAFYEAALEEATVGGDSFDVFLLNDDHMALVVCDASGKGLAAAERIAEIRFALRAFLREHADPCRALACLNDFVCDAQRLGKRDDGAFTTLTMVVLNGVTGELACLCAGGEPPLILRGDGAIEAARIRGSALGLQRDQKYQSASLHLAAGDMVLLATDGVTEARCPAREERLRIGGEAFLGIEGLAHLARQAHSPMASPGQIGRTVFEGARAFAGGAFHDDACLLVGRRQHL